MSEATMATHVERCIRGCLCGVGVQKGSTGVARCMRARLCRHGLQVCTLTNPEQVWGGHMHQRASAY